MLNKWCISRGIITSRDYDRAIEQALNTLELDSNFFEAYPVLGWAHAQKGNYDEAIAAYKIGISLEDGLESMVGWLGHAYALSGNTTEARQVLAKLKDKSTHSYISPYSIATIYIGLNDSDEAFEWLSKACEERNAWLPYLRVNPLFDTLRLDSRFADLLGRVGLSL